MPALRNEIREQAILEKISRLTVIDLENKSHFELLASTTEELGELSRELKIHYKTYGNTYKKPDEGPKTEAIDLMICAYCHYYAVDPHSDGIGIFVPNETAIFAAHTVGEKKWAFDELAAATMALGKLSEMLLYESEYIIFSGTQDCLDFQELTDELANKATNIFSVLGGTYDELLDLLEHKLNKWEKVK